MRSHQLTLAFAAIAFTSAQAQLPALHGTVRDPLGAAVPNATVELLDQRDHILATTSAGPQGDYSLAIPSSASTASASPPPPSASP